MPNFVLALPSHRLTHAADAVDFCALGGKVVAVLGAGASALDNAAVALEQGAAEVQVFCRRPTQLVQPYRWLTFAGFLRHSSDLDDAWRWRFMSTILGLREGFPQETWDRCACHANFHLHTGAPWLGARTLGERVELETPQGPFVADFAICATGVDIDFALLPELHRFAANIATWATALRCRPTCVTTALPALPTSATTSNCSRSFPAPRPGSATSTSLP
jgi:cation diffusion facilitator CzcD-associated flavoprotein CzcO